MKIQPNNSDDYNAQLSINQEEYQTIKDCQKLLTQITENWINDLDTRKCFTLENHSIQDFDNALELFDTLLSAFWINREEEDDD